MSALFQSDCTGRKIGYARVSTKDQKLRMQRDALKAAGCVRVFEDHGVSGAKGSRPGLDRMMAALRPGDIVVVFKLDRLGRSVLHLSDLLVRFHADGVQFCSLTEGIDTTTKGGRFTFFLFSAVAEFQRDIIVENTIEGMEAARRRGKRIGRPPVLSDEAIAKAHCQRDQIGSSVNDLAKQFKVSRATMRRALKHTMQ